MSPFRKGVRNAQASAGISNSTHFSVFVSKEAIVLPPTTAQILSSVSTCTACTPTTPLSPAAGARRWFGAWYSLNLPVVGSRLPMYPQPLSPYQTWPFESTSRS